MSLTEAQKKIARLEFFLQKEREQNIKLTADLRSANRTIQELEKYVEILSERTV